MLSARSPGTERAIDRSSGAAGSQRSAPRGKSNAGGITPTISIRPGGFCGPRCTRMLRPTIPASAPKCCFQNPSLTIAVRGSSPVSSEPLSGRPSAGGTPATSKNDADTHVELTRIRVLSLTMTMGTLTEANTAADSSDAACALQVSTSPSATSTTGVARAASISHITTVRSGTPNAMGRMRTASTTAYTAVVAPPVIDSRRMASAANARSRASDRAASRRSDNMMRARAG